MKNRVREQSWSAIVKNMGDTSLVSKRCRCLELNDVVHPLPIKTEV